MLVCFILPFHSVGISGCGKACFSSDRPKVHISIVGGGPAGFYTAQHLLKVCTSCFDNVPVGVGIRSGRYG